MKQQRIKNHALYLALPAKTKSFSFQVLLSLLFLGNTLIASAGICDRTWDAGKLMQISQANSLDYALQLKNQAATETVDTITVAQFQAFYEANQAIVKTTNLMPTFIICDNQDPNAFAMGTNQGMVVGVTLGLLKLVDGDRDMAAQVLGHEYTHHIKGHRANAQVRDSVLNLLGLVAGIALENALQKKYHIQNAGYRISELSTGLISRKFDRDQEREADSEGLKYMMQAGFSPAGATRLTEKMNKVGGGSGSFFDSHPGWVEREARLKTMIAQSAEAQQILASQGEYTKLARSDRQQVAKDLQIAALQPTYQSTDAEKSFNDALQALARKDYAEAVRHLRAAADAGHAVAQAGLGHMYLIGQGGLPIDKKEAVRLFRLSADQGNVMGQNNLGMAYSIGDGVSKDYAQALKLFNLSAAQGHPSALANIGNMYARGLGVSRNMDEAIRLFRLSADQGNVMGQHNLAYAYQIGDGVNKDYLHAVRFYKLASDQGYSLSQANLGIMYFQGYGVDKDYTEAARLCRLAAAQGNAAGENCIGYMLLNGAGVKKNVDEAVVWLRKAASSGDPSAIAILKKLRLM